jgi:hypothetical protein
MGNRGTLHNENKEIVTPSKRKPWVTCQLKFKDRHREVFGPNTYSELFFLDEATAFSAGHRPCATCRRDRYNAFKEEWTRANHPDAPNLPITEIDKQLHAERMARGGKKVTYVAEFGELPEGTFIERDGKAYLLWGSKLQEWTPVGYRQSGFSVSPGETVTVLTPRSIVVLFNAGFRPQVHESAHS